MTPAPIKLGHIGIGGYGLTHLRTARTLEPYGHCQTIAVADPMLERQPDIVEELKSSSVTVLNDPIQLLERGDIDAVIISSPIHHHAGQTIAALKAGKHVYLEKPPCATLGDWAQIVDARNSSGTICCVGFQMQTMPGVRYLKQQILSGALGEIKAVWSSLACCRADGYYNRSIWAGRMHVDGTPVFDGPATNAIAHVVHMAGYLAGTTEIAWGKIARVRGTLRRARPIESYDTSFVEAETTAGLPIRLAFTHATSRSDLVWVRVQGSLGTAALHWDGRVNLALNGQPARTLQYAFEPHFSGMLDFLRALRSPAEFSVASRIDDTLPYVQMVNGTLQSSGGVTPFPADQVERITEGSPQGVYRVKGLDDAITNFAADPNAVPPQLQVQPMPWINAADIKPRLVTS